ncbi:MAG: hypothetical protein FWD35_02255 [Oscillospiraceae bacterium]|nr:hypothetical protein [Oscillospiraceae bacterium]
MMNFNTNGANTNVTKVNPAVYNPYTKAMKNTKPAVSPAKKGSAGSFDMVEFDFAQVFEAAKAHAAEKLAAEMSAAAPDAARTNALAGGYANDHCPISGGEIASAIIGV